MADGVNLAADKAPLPAVDRQRRNRVIGYSLALAIFAVDQFVKWLMIGPLDLQNVRTIELLPFFNLHWTENPGVSLGLFSARTDLGRWALVALTAGIAGFVGIWLWREKRRDDSVALAMVLGGALGNIVDRVRFGYVVDYADLHIGEWRPFLVFNVADAAITIGVLLLLVRALLMREGKSDRKEK